MALLRLDMDMTSLAPCDMVVEAVFENLSIKREVFTPLEQIVVSVVRDFGTDGSVI